MPNRRNLLAALAVAPLAAAAARAATTADAALAEAVSNARRSPANRARDPWRHPAESLTFWGLRPGMTVLEIEPSGGYWAEILAPYLKATGGRYIGAPSGDADAFRAKYGDAAIWGGIETTKFLAPSGAALGPPGSVDLVLTARNLHDWIWTPGQTARALADIRAVLKTGGILAVEEHRADPRPMVADARDGYVNTAWLTGAVESAGFRLQAASEINANPHDPKDHPFGVWTLPPTLRSHRKGEAAAASYDAAKYIAIGESDRMTLRFSKL